MAAAAAPKAEGAATTAPTPITRSRPIRIGMLGASWIAQRAVVDAAKPLKGLVEAYAVAARSKIRATQYAATLQIPVVHDDYGALVADPMVDAVYVGLQNSGHAEWALKALRAGKHVLCEKPMACNQIECRAISAEARRAGGGRLVCMEAFHYRYHPLMRRVVELISTGKIGTAVKRVEARFGIYIRDVVRDIRFQWSLGGGALMDTGPYVVHAMRTCLNTPVTGATCATPHELALARQLLSGSAAASSSSTTTTADEQAGDSKTAPGKSAGKSAKQKVAAAKQKTDDEDDSKEAAADGQKNPSNHNAPPLSSAQALEVLSRSDDGYYEPELDVVKASCKLAWPNVDQSASVDLESADFLREQTAFVECSLRTLIPKVSLVVYGTGKGKIEVTNFVAPHLVYSSLTVTDPITGVARNEKIDHSQGSTYTCQLRAFAEGVHVAETAWRERAAATAAAGDNKSSAAAAAEDIQSHIRAVIPTDHVDAVKTQRITDSVYVALGLPLRGVVDAAAVGKPQPPPTTAAKKKVVAAAAAKRNA